MNIKLNKDTTAIISDKAVLYVTILASQITIALFTKRKINSFLSEINVKELLKNGFKKIGNHYINTELIESEIIQHQLHTIHFMNDENVTFKDFEDKVLIRPKTRRKKVAK